MKKNFFVASLIAAFGLLAQTLLADEPPAAIAAPITTALQSADDATNAASNSAPLVLFSPNTVVTAYPRVAYLIWPAMSFGFGFGHPFVSGYFHPEHTRVDSSVHP